jgi:hypothetical protein
MDRLSNELLRHSLPRLPDRPPKLAVHQSLGDGGSFSESRSEGGSSELLKSRRPGRPVPRLVRHSLNEGGRPGEGGMPTRDVSRRSIDEGGTLPLSPSLRWDKPPRKVPGRVVIAPSLAPRIPSQNWGQCRHHQDKTAAKGPHWWTINWAANFTCEKNSVSLHDQSN